MKASVYVCLCIWLQSLVSLGTSAQTTHDGASHFDDGVKYYEARNYGKAKECFESAVKQNRNDADAHFYLANIHLRREFRDLEKAEDYIDEAIDLNDKNAKYHFTRGQILGLKAQSASKLSAAFIAPKVKNAFLRAVELDPSYVDARLGLFNYYLLAPGIMGGSEEEALKQAQEVMRLDKYRGHVTLAAYYRRKKDPAQAESELKKAIESEPQKSMAYHQLGYLYLEQSRFDDAIAQFKKYVEVDPKNPNSYDSLADALLAQGKYDEAIEKYNYALFLDKTYSSSIYGLAQCYEKKGMNVKAIETYQWYLSADASGRYADVAQQKLKELQ